MSAEEKEDMSYQLQGYKLRKEDIEKWKNKIGVDDDADIVRNCISIIDSILCDLAEAVEGGWDTEEYGRFGYRITYMELVKHLLLWGTNHSGGTSTGMKCREMGFDPYEEITFGPAGEEDDEDEEDDDE